MHSASEHEEHGPDLAMPERRRLLKKGVPLAAPPLVAGGAVETRAQEPTGAAERGPTRRAPTASPRNIKADVELVGPGEIDRAWARVRSKDVRYRFVIDLTTGKGEGA